ncbi:FUSC family protein [Streptomyces ochraceiscleroticus]|uniref:FUSC family protein n=1 Tax=Streptomyces ochraceiscleroticus TaxID=47761 RepID=A0ABW1MS77_9ACTN|nr:FUSC family protein [Streptomyces ochraceiscleroticus]
MGKHAGPTRLRQKDTKNHAKSDTKNVGGVIRTRPLPVKSTVRLRRPLERRHWHKPAFSAAVAIAVPDLALLALDRMDLVLYTSAGAMCALYGHNKPYAARARTVAWVVLSMIASLAVGLVSSAFIGNTMLLVLIASALAAVHKMMCDATRIGPPGNLIITFISASAFFVPQQPGLIPFHLLLAVAGGAVAWLVCMAPWLVRPEGPQRIATARALEAAAGLLRAAPDAAGPRHATSAAVNAGWQTLFLVPARSAAKYTARARLERLLIHAESALAEPAAGARAADAARFDAWAQDLRRGRPLPEVALDAGQAAELAGIAADQAALAGAGQEALARTAAGSGPDGGAVDLRRPSPDHLRGFRPVLKQLRPGSPLLPIGARVMIGCTLAGWASMAVGSEHPYWAVVTAASVFQANTTLSWQRAVQRALGNLLGLLLFTALLPVIHTGHLAMVLLVLLFQIGAEAWIPRNYWLGSVCVTPMALLLTSFGNAMPAGVLVRDRWVDTVVGAVIGLVCCVLVTNRRATDRIEAAVARVVAAREAAAAVLEADLPDDPETGNGGRYEAGHEAGCEAGREAGWARDRLAAALVELREAVEVASGEWWQRALPAERVALTERDGHRTLARLVRLLTAPTLAA